MVRETVGTAAILGAGNIGRALAEGWVAAGSFTPDRIVMTRRRADQLGDLQARGFRAGADNPAAVREADVVVLAVQPQQLPGLLEEIRPAVADGRQLVISVATGVPIADIVAGLGTRGVVRAMPNTAIAIRQSMTCLAVTEGAGPEHLAAARALFDAVGETLIIPEELMVSATALCACGIAFFLRSIRAASQGGIEIGFHPEEAMLMAAQTAKGAASLLVAAANHPEAEIDRVTTPRGCTIAGLNEMEHRGFSSALIKGILTSARKAAGLYDGA